MSTQQAVAVMKRYRDAYIVARATVRFGRILKGLGWFFALASAFVAFVTVGTTLLPNLERILSDPDASVQAILAAVAALIGLIIWAAFILLIFYYFGVTISAQGQNLMASLDDAVNSSPFLSDAQRAEVMSIPRTA